ncbi:hypothetical protein V5799_004918, partial [Amblyomma americanum]
LGAPDVFVEAPLLEDNVIRLSWYQGLMAKAFFYLVEDENFASRLAEDTFNLENDIALWSWTEFLSTLFGVKKSSLGEDLYVLVSSVDFLRQLVPVFGNSSSYNNTVCTPLQARDISSSRVLDGFFTLSSLAMENRWSLTAPAQQRPIYVARFGFTVARQLLQAVLPQGWLVDNSGRFRAWWSQAARSVYDKRTFCLARQYTDHTWLPAAPSRFANSPHHSKAAAWSSTASSTPVFKPWCPWDRFSGHESSVAATMAKRPPLFAMQALLPLVVHSIYICHPARDSASLHQVTQFASYHVPPFVHQAAPSRFANSPHHSKAAAWSSTASSTPVFKPWCPWDRFSGHDSSVAATMAKRPPLFAMQALLPLVVHSIYICHPARDSASLHQVTQFASYHVPPFVHQAAPSRFANSPYHSKAAAWSSTASSTPVFKPWCPWDRFSGHESSVAATMAKRPPLFAMQVLLPLVVHSIYICHPARDSASLHQVTQFASYHVPPFVHQAAPSRFANSPYHSKAAAWSSTASSTPVFKRWCPWDRFSGHESSVAATMAKRPPLFAMQCFSAPSDAVCFLSCASVRSSGGALKICEQSLSLQGCGMVIDSKFNASI